MAYIDVDELLEWAKSSQQKQEKPKRWYEEFYLKYIKYPIDDYGLLFFIVSRVFIICFILFMSFICLYFIDSLFLEKHIGIAIIENKYYISSSTNYIYFSSPKTTILIPQTIPDSFNLELNINGLYDNFQINQTLYNDLKINEKIHCTYTIGRITGNLYIKTLNGELNIK
jgi:hypothetical protein